MCKSLRFLLDRFICPSFSSFFEFPSCCVKYSYNDIFFFVGLRGCKIFDWALTGFFKSCLVSPIVVSFCPITELRVLVLSAVPFLVSFWMELLALYEFAYFAGPFLKLSYSASYFKPDMSFSRSSKSNFFVIKLSFFKILRSWSFLSLVLANLGDY